MSRDRYITTRYETDTRLLIADRLPTGRGARILPVCLMNSVGGKIRMVYKLSAIQNAALARAGGCPSFTVACDKHYVTHQPTAIRFRFTADGWVYPFTDLDQLLLMRKSIADHADLLVAAEAFVRLKCHRRPTCPTNRLGLQKEGPALPV
jgi:hypothetical protein